MEKKVHEAVVNYLRLAYPKVLFRSDTGAGMKLTIGQARNQKKIQNNMAWPDLFISEARGGYFGLYIELKDNNVKLMTKAGQPASDHIRNQNDCGLALRYKGYYATFACGFDQAQKLIDTYMSYEPTLPQIKPYNQLYNTV